MNWLEVSLVVNGELAEAVADVLARFAPNGVMTEQGVKFLNDEDEGTATGPITVRAYLPMDDHIEETRQNLKRLCIILARSSLYRRRPSLPSPIRIGWKHGSSITNRSPLAGA